MNRDLLDEMFHLFYCLFQLRPLKENGNPAGVGGGFLML